jgi:hypothetical protein
MPFFLIFFPIFLFSESAKLINIVSPTKYEMVIDHDINIVCSLRAISSFESVKKCRSTKQFNSFTSEYISRRVQENKNYWLEDLELIEDNHYWCNIESKTTSLSAELLQDGFAIYDENSDVKSALKKQYEDAKQAKNGLWYKYQKAMECYEK